MLALHRSRGLAAVQGLWKSANRGTDSTDYRAQPSPSGFGGKGDAALLTLCARPLPEPAPVASTRRGWRKAPFATRTLPWSALASATPGAAAEPAAALGSNEGGSWSPPRCNGTCNVTCHVTGTREAPGLLPGVTAPVTSLVTSPVRGRLLVSSQV